MQSALGLTIAGLAIIFLTVAVLIRGKVSPIVPMALIPAIGALILGYSFEELSDFFSDGLKSVMSVVVMFIFAIIFFGIMQDVGLFTPVIRALVKATRGNPVFITLGTAAIGVVAHLDGSGSTTFLLTIPALLPLYKAMRMSRYTLLMIVALAASVMNMVPWAGPVGRAGSVIAQDPHDIWTHLLPAQGIALLGVFAVAAVLGVLELRRARKRSAQKVGAGEEVAGPANIDVEKMAAEFAENQRQQQAEIGLSFRSGRAVTVINILLILAVLVVLLAGLLPPAPAFLIATTVAMLVNCQNKEAQTGVLNRHAPNALSMAGVIIAASMFLGVLNGSGMLEEIALQLIAIMPEGVGQYLHIIVAFLGVPLDLLTSTDAYYFSVLPIVQETAANFGVSGMGAAAALIVGNVIGTFVSPFSPALWLALGLAEGQMGHYLKRALPLVWGFSIILVAISWGMGMFA